MVHPANEQQLESEQSSVVKQPGVVAAEAAREVAGWKLYVAWLGIALVSYVNGLDNNTMYAYITAATNEQKKYQLYTSVQVTQQVIIAVGKFPIAAFSNIFGRAEGYILSLALYVLGFIIIASCQSFGALVAGVVFYAFGSTGVQIMQQIVIADWVPTKWRGAAIGLVSIPYIINFAIAPKIAEQLAPFGVAGSLWRWGPGIFAIIVPVATAPIILTLALSQRKAKKEGLVERHPYFSMSFFGALRAFVIDIDVVGLLLLAGGFILILLPLNLSGNARDGWASTHIIVMLCVGGVSLIALGFWEWLGAPNPIIKKSYLLNKDVLLPALFIGLFDFAAFYLSWTSAYVWSRVTFGWSNEDAIYFSNTQSLCLTVFGIAAGFLALATKRYKWILVSGACIRLLGLGIMIRYRDQSATTVQAVFPQVLQGLGGGLMGVTLQVSAQVSVRHQNVAMVTAFVLLFTEIGGAIGSAILGSLQTHLLRDRVTEYFAPLGVSAANLALAYTSPAFFPFALGTPERDALIRAWSDYMHIALIIACALSAVPIIAGLFLTDHKLGDGQNCVSDELAGHGIGRAAGTLPDDEETNSNDMDKRSDSSK